jgi:cell division protein FtsZ
MGLKQLAEKTLAERAKEVDEELRSILESRRTQIKVVGAGGAGNNTLTRLMQIGIVGTETIAVNTDAQDLLYSDADKKVLIGRELTSGLGAGADPKIGMEAAKESRDDLKRALQGADMVFLTCGLGGGCLRGSSLIFTNPEGPVRIDSIKSGSTVYTFSNGTIIKRKVLAAMKTGIKRVVELKTKNKTICASEDHPFLRVKPLNVLSNDRFSKFALEWAELRSLRVGDLVVVLRELPDEGGPLKLPDGSFTDEKFCQLFGFLLGDGWISKSGDSWKICFSPSTDEKNNQKYLNLMKEVFGLEMKKAENWYYASSKKVYELLEKLDLHKHAKEKEIPSWVFSLPKDQKKAFVMGLADADGHYSVQTGKSGLPKKEIKFEMSSEKLISSLKILCDSIGLRTSNVTSRKRILKPPSSKESRMFTSWILRIYKTHELLGVLPHSRSRSGLSFLYKFRSRETPDFFKYFGFNRVMSIKEIGNEEVYDITVEGSHNFIADGFVVHNTGTGSLPVVAEIAKKLGALTLAIVTLPFSMEGKQRMANAREGLSNLEGLVDTLIVIPNDKLLEIVPDVSLQTAFKVCDEILVNGVKGIAELVTKPGLINLDFADVRAVMGQGGLAMIGMGESDTENRAFEAVEKALSNPLITVDVDGAKGALINVIGGPDVTIKEAQQIVEAVSSKLAPDAKIIWGAQIAKELGDAVRAMLIVTGVQSPQIFGPGKLWSKEEKKDIEKILGVDFVE